MTDKSIKQAKHPGCAHCNHPLFAAMRCNVCGKVHSTDDEQPEPVAWSHWMVVDGELCLQWPMATTKEEAERDVLMYEDTCRVGAEVRPLYIHPDPRVAELEARIAFMQGERPSIVGWPWDSPYMDGVEAGKAESRERINELESSKALGEVAEFGQLQTALEELTALRASNARLVELITDVKHDLVVQAQLADESLEISQGLLDRMNEAITAEQEKKYEPRTD